MEAFMLILGFIGLLNRAEGFSAGLPSKVCLDGIPHHHGLSRQITRPPFSLVLDKTTYSPGDVVKVTLESDGNVAFRGFTVRANRAAGDTESLVGEFRSDPSSGERISFYPETPGTTNCIAHNDSEAKTKVTAEWVAPSSSIGDIVFEANFVRDFQTFWLGVTQTLISAEVSLQSASYGSETSTAVDQIDLSGCGDTKGCFLYPTGCSDAKDCSHAVTWRNASDSGDTGGVGGADIYEFELLGAAPDFLSVGFSDDIMMGDDHIFTCVSSPSGSMVQHGYCPSYYCERHLIRGVLNNQVAKADGKIFCRFQRPAAMTLTLEKRNPVTKIRKTVEKTFSLSLRDYYIFIAWGKVYEDTDGMKKHQQLPLVSYSRVRFQGHDLHHGQQLPTEFKIHASFGVVSWLLLVGFSMIVARHGRGMLGGDCCGSKTWLRVHQMCMVFGVVLSIIGVVLIFIYLNKWTEHAVVHAVLGLVSVGLALIQMLGGVLRPNPKHTCRPVWTWIHRLQGAAAFILAGVCVVLGFNTDLIEEGLRYRETIISLVWICFHLVFDFIFEILTLKDAVDSEKKSSNVKLTGSSVLLKMALVIYSVGLLFLTALSVTLIYLV